MQIEKHRTQFVQRDAGSGSLALSGHETWPPSPPILLGDPLQPGAVPELKSMCAP